MLKNHERMHRVVNNKRSKQFTASQKHEDNFSLQGMKRCLETDSTAWMLISFTASFSSRTIYIIRYRNRFPFLTDNLLLDSRLCLVLSGTCPQLVHWELSPREHRWARTELGPDLVLTLLMHGDFSYTLTTDLLLFTHPSLSASVPQTSPFLALSIPVCMFNITSGWQSQHM